MKNKRMISLALCCSSLLMTPVSIMASDWGLDIESANDAFGEMAGEFEKQRDNYGNIEIYDKSEIYDRYQNEISTNKVVLDADKKLADFKNHKYEGYGTISELNEKLSDQYKKGAEDNESSFADKLKESEKKDDFIDSIKEDLDKKKEDQSNGKEQSKSNAVQQQARYQSLKKNFASVIESTEPATSSASSGKESNLLSFDELLKNIPKETDNSNENVEGSQITTNNSQIMNDYLDTKKKFQFKQGVKDTAKSVMESLTPIGAISNKINNAIEIGKGIIHNLVG